VDVYADWVDACDAVAKEAAVGGATERSVNRSGALPRTAEEDFVVQDDLDAEGDYDAD
jgi:transcription elongation factor Elf1